jgi:hypothetical protein
MAGDGECSLTMLRMVGGMKGGDRYRFLDFADGFFVSTRSVRRDPRKILG